MLCPVCFTGMEEINTEVNLYENTVKHWFQCENCRIGRLETIETFYLK